MATDPITDANVSKTDPVASSAYLLLDSTVTSDLLLDICFSSTAALRQALCRKSKVSVNYHSTLANHKRGNQGQRKAPSLADLHVNRNRFLTGTGWPFAFNGVRRYLCDTSSPRRAGSSEGIA